MFDIAGNPLEWWVIIAWAAAGLTAAFLARYRTGRGRGLVRDGAAGLIAGLACGFVSRPLFPGPVGPMPQGSIGLAFLGAGAVVLAVRAAAGRPYGAAAWGAAFQQMRGSGAPSGSSSTRIAPSGPRTST